MITISAPLLQIEIIKPGYDIPETIGNAVPKL